MRLEDREIVLASASPRRLELLRQLGLCPGVQPSEADEHSSERDPARFVQELARRKAGLVAATEAAGTLVIGADTVVVRDGCILGKPKDRADAVTMLKSLSGRAHEVYTGVALVIARESRQAIFAAETRVYIAPMTEDEIQAYVDSGEPMDKAGAYGIQGRFACFVEKIEGEYSNVVGLPLAALRRAAQELERDGK
jgi:septum formation protein maf